jgi:hypothetical protein
MAGRQTTRRFDDLKDLLVAFDVYARFRTVLYGPAALDRPSKEQRTPEESQLRQAEAEFYGRLDASTEELPLTRQVSFGYIKPAALEDALKEFLAAIGSVGDPEVEENEIVVVRGELLSVLSKLRHDLERQRSAIQSSSY